MSDIDYAKRGLEIMKYLKRHGVISMNRVGLFYQGHLEAIAKIGAGEPLEEPLVLPDEVFRACRKVVTGTRGAKKYKLGSYFFSFLDENGNVTDKKKYIDHIVFPELSLSLKINDGHWQWDEYNEESIFLLALDNHVDIVKTNYTVSSSFYQSSWRNE